MPRALVKARDASHPDPEKDRRGCYKRGDVVAVMPDGHVWGAMEGPPNFVHVDITGASLEVLQRLVEEQDDDDDGNYLGVEDDGVTRRRWRRRRFRINLDNLPLARRNELASRGQTTITRVSIRNHLRRKRDGGLLPNI